MSNEASPLDTPIDEWGRRRGIRASAGSGKTYALTGHYLRSLLQGADPATMLATTFTRKAAGEILGRVLLRLSKAAASEDAARELGASLNLEELDSETARWHLLRLCRALHQVSISTIDSFFGQLLRGFRPDLGLPPDYRVIEEGSPDMERLRSEAIREMLDRSEQDSLLQLLDSLQQGAVNSGVISQLDNWFSKAHGLFELTQAPAWQVGFVQGSQLGAAERQAAIERIESLAIINKGRLATALTDDAARARGEDWEKFLTTGLPKAILYNGALYYKQELDIEIQAAYDPLITHARSFLLNRQAASTQALHQMLVRFYEAFTDLSTPEGVILFRHVPQLLRRFLPRQESDEVRHRLDADIDHLLLDEFQDTDPQQYAILKPIAESIHATQSEQGLIFCVGDLKQSIYGWRGATPQVFERFGTDLPQVAWSDNNTSYRSSQVVLDAVNRVFGTLTENVVLATKSSGSAQRWQAFFQDHGAHKKDIGGYVELIQSRSEEADDDYSDELTGEEETQIANPHFEFAARRVRDLVHGAPGASVGVLMRSNEAVRQMIFALRRLGVEASAEGGSPIDDDPAVGVLLAALQFADHPGDSAARFHLVHSPLAEVLRLDGPRRLPIAQAAYEIRRHVLRDGYAAAIGIWAEILAPYCDARGATRLGQLLELAELYGNRDMTRPGEFVRYVRLQNVEEPSPASVKVMTIHRSKGLEFDIVVLPELHKKLQIPTKLIYSRDPETLEIDRVCAYPNEVLRMLSGELEAIYQDYTASEMREALCLLYVAMTRARYGLHMILPAQGQKKDGTPKSYGHTLAGIVHAALAGEEGTGATFYSHGDSDWYRNTPRPAQSIASAKVRREVSPLELESQPPRSWKRISPSAQEGGAKKTAAQLLNMGGQSARRQGIVLHDWLSRIEWPDEAIPEDAELARRFPGLPDETRAALLEDFRRMVEKPGTKAALQKPKTQAGESWEVWREQRFAVLVDGELVSGTFDRVEVLRDANGNALKAQVVDFKTGKQSVEDAIEIYADQLETYRRALAAMLGLDEDLVTAKIIFAVEGEAVTMGSNV